MRYDHKSLRDAADIVIHRQLKDLGGEGGVIAVDGQGNIAMPFEARGMFRGSIDAEGKIFIAIFDK